MKALPYYIFSPENKMVIALNSIAEYMVVPLSCFYIYVVAFGFTDDSNNWKFYTMNATEVLFFI